MRWFNKDYNAAQATLRGILKDEPPKAISDRLSVLDQLIEGQTALWDISVKEGDDELGRRAFGSYWRAQHSDWEQLSAIDNWEAECRQAKLPPAFRQVMARMEDLSHTKRLVRQIGSDLKPALQEVNRLLQDLQVDMSIAFGNTSLYAIPLEDVRMRFQSWLDNTELLAQWMLFHTRREKLESLGMSELIDRLFNGNIEPGAAQDRFRIAYYEALMRRVVSACPVFASFNGLSHERLIGSFQQCDMLRIDLARHEVALAHFERLPQDRTGIGELGIIQREIEKKRRHLPLRQLLKKAGNAIQAIKPVFMMSPISVAQFLEPGQLNFDLLLIDEASQVSPVDALGAIARAAGRRRGR